MLFVILPLIGLDSVLQQLTQLGKRKDSNTIVIAVQEKIDIGQLVQAKASDPQAGGMFIVSEAMQTKKNATEQHELFRWLTHKNYNRHFDMDVVEAGQKFFVDESGELYAVLGNRQTLLSPIVNKILLRTLPASQAH